MVIPETAVRTGIPIFPFLHNLLISLLYLFEAGFRLVFVGIVDIRIRMIFPAQGAVCFLYLFVRCAL